MDAICYVHFLDFATLLHAVALPCGDNEYVASNRCIGCEAGMSNEAGDDPSGDDTACKGAARKRVRSDFIGFGQLWRGGCD